MKARLTGIALAATMIAAVAGIAVAQDFVTPDVASMSVEEIVKLRQDLMKEDGRLLRSAMAPDADRVAAADHLIHNIGVLKTLWPEGSIVGDSEALPAIWTDRATFDGLFDQMIAGAGVVKTAAAAGDTAGAEAALKSIGGLCGQCHNTFRVKD